MPHSQLKPAPSWRQLLPGAALALSALLLGAVAHPGLAAAAPVQRLAQREGTLIVGGQGVADFRLGARYSEFCAVLGKPTRSQVSRNANDASGYFFKRFGLLFFVKKDRVNGISVSSPLMQTPEGVRVGSARELVSRCYGSPQALGAGSDRLVYPERGLGFDFKAGRVANIYVFDKEARDLVSGDRRIVAGARVGGMQLGQGTDGVTRSWQQADTQSDLPSKPGARLWSYKSHGVVVVVFEGRIDGVWLFNPEFRTSEDLGVGSTQAEVRKAYGRPSAVEKGLEMYGPRGIGFLYEKGRAVEVMVLKPGR